MHKRTVPRAEGPAVRPLWMCRRHALALVVTAVAAVALVTQSSCASGATLRASSARPLATGRAIDAKYFEPGACVEYPPTSGDRHLTVFLDAGHGGIDPGGVGETQSGQTVEEAD